MARSGQPTPDQRPPSEAEVPISPRMRRALQTTTLIGALATLAVGLVTTIGWWVLDEPSVARISFPGAAPVRPLTGLALLPAGLALLLLWRADRRSRPAPIVAVRALATLLLVASLVGLLDVTLDLQLDPAERLLDLHGFSDAIPRGVACVFAIAGVAFMFAVARDRVARLVAQALALLVMAVGLLLVLDVVLAWAFATVPRTYSPATAGMMVAFGVGLATYRPVGGPIAVVASSLPSGALARRIGVAVLVIEPLIAVAGFGLHDAGHLDAEAAFAGVAAATLALVVGATAVFATRLAPAEAARAVAVTEHRRTAERLRDLYDGSPTGYCSIDTGGMVREVNGRLCEWLGRSREELLGTPFSALVTADGRPAFEDALGLLRAGRALPEVDLELVAAHGALLPVAFAATPVLDPDGALRVARATVFDITDRRRAEEQRATAERRYRTIVETALEGVASLDQSGRVLFANARLGELLGVVPEGLVGRRLEELVDPADRVAVAERRARRIAGDHSRQQFEVRFPRADGSTRWAIVSSAPRSARTATTAGPSSPSPTSPPGAPPSRRATRRTVATARSSRRRPRASSSSARTAS